MKPVALVLFVIITTLKYYKQYEKDLFAFPYNVAMSLPELAYVARASF